MKKWIIALGILAVASAAATTSFDRVNALKEELKLHHVDGKKAEATLVASNLALGGENEPYGPHNEDIWHLIKEALIRQNKIESR